MMSQSRYRNGEIYKIVSNKTGLVYIGSTCKTLPQRIAQHERDYKQYLKTGKKYNIYMTSFKILKMGIIKFNQLKTILVKIVKSYMHEKNIGLKKQIVLIKISQHKHTRNPKLKNKLFV